MARGHGMAYGRLNHLGYRIEYLYHVGKRFSVSSWYTDRFHHNWPSERVNGTHRASLIGGPRRLMRLGRPFRITMSAMMGTMNSTHRRNASGISVVPVQTFRHRRSFLDMPWSLYGDHDHWIPSLRMLERELLGFSAHPFYQNNSVQTFLAKRGTKDCGRIAAILNQDHNQHHGERRGFWGFFECVDDADVARSLFDGVRQWFADQGIDQLRGPVNPSFNYTGGLLIDGFDLPPAFLMPYNPPYYTHLVESCGFVKSQDLYAYHGDSHLLSAVVKQYGPKMEQMFARMGLEFRTLSQSGFREDIAEFLSVYNKSLARTWGFVPMSRAEIDHMAAGLRRLLVPELAVAVEIEGRMVGATFCVPDYNPLIKAIRGRLLPFGFLRLLRARRRLKKVRLMSINVLPEYQRTGMGLVVMAHLLPSVVRLGIEEAEISWILESNRLSWGSLEKAGARRIKTYRIYDSS